jgi:hypothetical protein
MRFGHRVVGAALAALALASPALAGRGECLVAWRIGERTSAGRRTAVACRDGDPTCDRDGAADGRCLLPVALCERLDGCAGTAPAVTVRGRAARPLGQALAALGSAPAGEVCTAPAEIAVRAGRRVALRARARDRASRLRDGDRLLLRCGRAGAGRAGRARAVVVTSDFETGVLATVRVRAPHATARLDTPIHSDAVVRVVGDRVYVVNRFLGDNLQVLDRGLTTRLQCSTGPGSNPHDVAVVGPHKAYVTRYDERALWIVDPGAGSCAGFREGAIDLGAFADADGLPEMDQMALVGDRLFVSVERLDRTRRFAPTGPSALVVVDTATDQVTGSIELAGSNVFGDASGIVREPGTGKLVVATVGDFFRTGDGGLERVDPESLASEGFVITESALGGNVTDFVLASPTKGYAVLFVPSAPPRNVLVAFDPSRGVVTRRLLTSVNYLADVALAPDGTLWLADQTLPAPGIRIFDVETDRRLTRGVIDVGLPPFAIGFLP